MVQGRVEVLKCWKKSESIEEEEEFSVEEYLNYNFVEVFICIVYLEHQIQGFIS